ncbi:hypothetical protein GCM10009630_58660 [Kribbella jejuensis]|uniref:23S rRNA G2445 N2-methylase RlmL n=1 Tax=Kribbella jejuensis TaxID=236068 RepID=A0A542EN61_9ACTN|nr:methyltransferase domain-containing protein [Kribbella jejuensis]TQJ16792.1 23S rRNA G2445 N2-methylase RlmL [Kribbella jejuensis]
MRSALVLLRAVAGLEWLVAEEVAAAGHRVVEVSKRQVVVEGLVDPPRVADDLFVVYGLTPDPGRAKAGVVAAIRAALPSVAVTGGAFAVSASFVGVRNFNRYDVEDAVGERIARLTGGRYHSRRHGVVPPDERAEWRVVLDGKTLWIALRPYAEPLHRRPYRQHTVPGSLHPPVAAAMARLSGPAPEHRVLDPFCGAGTILLEAHHLEPRAHYLGIDRDPAATAAARANWATAAGAADRRGARHSEGAGVVWRRGDARWVESGFDRVLSNPPWDVRVGSEDVPSALRRWREVLLPGGLVVTILLPEQTELLRRRWRVEARYDVAVAGKHPVIVVARP